MMTEVCCSVAGFVLVGVLLLAHVIGTTARSWLPRWSDSDGERFGRLREWLRQLKITLRGFFFQLMILVPFFAA